MKTSLSCLLLGLIIISCAPAAKEDAGGNLQDSFADSLFSHNGQRAFRSSDLIADYDTAAKQYRLTALSEEHRKLLTDTLFGASPYAAYYYSILPKVGTALPLTVLSEATDASPVHLFVLAADGSVAANMKLADDNCDTQGASGEQSECSTRFSAFADDSTVMVTDVFRSMAGKVSSVDSVVTTYRITRSGALKMLTAEDFSTRKQ